MGFKLNPTLRVLGVVSALLSAAWLPMDAVAGNLLCCQDGNGRRACGDSLPEVCRGRNYRVMDQNGNVIREVAAPPTAEQKAAVAAEQERKRQEEQKALEQRRRDSALLQTYSHPDDITMAQNKAETDARLLIGDLTARLEQLDKRRKHLLAAGAGASPGKSMKDVDIEMAQVEAYRAQKQKDLDLIRQRYEADRQRYTEITGRR